MLRSIYATDCALLQLQALQNFDTNYTYPQNAQIPENYPSKLRINFQ